MVVILQTDFESILAMITCFSNSTCYQQVFLCYSNPLTKSSYERDLTMVCLFYTSSVLWAKGKHCWQGCVHPHWQQTFGAAKMWLYCFAYSEWLASHFLVVPYNNILLRCYCLIKIDGCQLILTLRTIAIPGLFSLFRLHWFRNSAYEWQPVLMQILVVIIVASEWF